MIRHPDETRRKLLETAFWTFYEHGYQASGIDAIISKAGVTKGALYHHFKTKKDLGLAVIDEVIRGWMHDQWIRPLATEGEPIAQLRRVVRAALEEAGVDGVRLGCPLNNFAQEMSPLDEDFRVRIETVFADWRTGVAAALRRGQTAKQLRADMDPDATAAFIVASLEGGMSTAKSAQSIALARTLVGALDTYLETLRVPDAQTKRRTSSSRGRQAGARARSTRKP